MHAAAEGREKGIVMGGDVTLSVSDFVAVCNQTLEYAYPSVIIVGELANLRVSRGRWVYFDLKDEYSSVKFFGTVQQLPGPLEDGLILQVRGAPRLHNLYGFSVNVQFMQPVGEGSIKKAGDLLAAKLEAEGLFASGRKRSLPLAPQKIGLITSEESAAYRDFIKVLNGRWSGVEVLLYNVQVQGEPAVTQVVAAIEYFAMHDTGVEVLVLTRGGGSADDLAAFGTEQITRAVAGSRVPTLVAIGHEVDVSLSELAADVRASTPSNAAELLFPDRKHGLQLLQQAKDDAGRLVTSLLHGARADADQNTQALSHAMIQVLRGQGNLLDRQRELLTVLSPLAALRRGYAVLRGKNSQVIRSITHLKAGDTIHAQLHDGLATLDVREVQ